MIALITFVTSRSPDILLSFYQITSEKRALRARISTLFIAVTFENYERYFFYEILVLIKSKNIKSRNFFYFLKSENIFL